MTEISLEKAVKKVFGEEGLKSFDIIHRDVECFDQGNFRIQLCNESLALSFRNDSHELSSVIEELRLIQNYIFYFKIKGYIVNKKPEYYVRGDKMYFDIIAPRVTSQSNVNQLCSDLKELIEGEEK